MSLSKRCPHKDCHELVPMDAIDCGGHVNPHKCLDCSVIVYGNVQRCPNCRLILHRKNDKEYKQRVAAVVETEIEQIKPWVPKPRPILVTEEEQTLINEAAMRAEAARIDTIYKEMGLSSAKGRQLSSDPVSLPKEKIAELARVYQPPQPRGILPYPVLCQSGR